MQNNRRVSRSESGIGLTELAVAIVVLGIVLVGLFPLVIDSVRLAAQNAEVAQANRIVAAKIDQSRGQLENTVCDASKTENKKSLPLTAPDNQEFQADRTVSCGTNRLATVSIRVQSLSAASVTIAEATTQVVTAAPAGTP